MAPQVPTNGAAAPAGLLATVKAKTLAGCWGRQECTAEATAACTDTGAPLTASLKLIYIMCVLGNPCYIVEQTTRWYGRQQ